MRARMTDRIAAAVFAVLAAAPAAASEAEVLAVRTLMEAAGFSSVEVAGAEPGSRPGSVVARGVTAVGPLGSVLEADTVRIEGYAARDGAAVAAAVSLGGFGLAFGDAGAEVRFVGLDLTDLVAKPGHLPGWRRIDAREGSAADGSGAEFGIERLRGRAVPAAVSFDADLKLEVPGWLPVLAGAGAPYLQSVSFMIGREGDGAYATASASSLPFGRQSLHVSFEGLPSGFEALMPSSGPAPAFRVLAAFASAGGIPLKEIRFSMESMEWVGSALDAVEDPAGRERIGVREEAGVLVGDVLGTFGSPSAVRPLSEGIAAFLLEPSAFEAVMEPSGTVTLGDVAAAPRGRRLDMLGAGRARVDVKDAGR